MSVEAVKVKLSFHCGTSPSAMVLSLLDENGTMLYTLWEDHRKLGYYSPRDGYALHIVDSDPTSASAGGWLENTALVEKYKMSDEDYSKRENTYRRWKVRLCAAGGAVCMPQYLQAHDRQSLQGVSHIYIPPTCMVLSEACAV